MTAQELTSIVANQNAGNDRLRAEVATLQNQLAELQADRANGATSVGQIAVGARRIPGVDRPRSDRRAGVQITVSGEIDAAAVDDLLNELRNAGAEAIAIDDVRVIARTSIGGVPGSLDVDGFLLRDPFTIRAIGGPESPRRVADPGRRDHRPARGDRTGRGDRDADRQPMTLPATTRDLVPDHGRPRL